MTSTRSEWPSSKHVPAEELARRHSIGPIESVDELARPGTFESDEEADDLLVDLHASRRGGGVSLVGLDRPWPQPSWTSPRMTA